MKGRDLSLAGGFPTALISHSRRPVDLRMAPDDSLFYAKRYCGDKRASGCDQRKSTAVLIRLPSVSEQELMPRRAT